MLAGAHHKNGVASVRPFGNADREPLARVLEIGDRAWRVLTGALVIAILLHGTASAKTLMHSPELFNWGRDIENRVIINLTETIDIETEKPKPPPPPEPPKEEEKAKPIEQIQKDVPPPPPPAAAQAGKVLTAATDPNAPVDFTGDGFVSGNGENYTGGITQAGGTSTKPIYNPNARATGVPGGTGAPAPTVQPGPDRSRAASRAGSDEWRCDFPPEADSEQIDEAYVTLQVLVGPDGHAKKVTVVQDPGHGFGRMAYQCAQRESYNAPFDHDGNPIEGMTPRIRVHFSR
ncbi:MAG: energy transducer TonB [Polyangiaceae bacterium]